MVADYVTWIKTKAEGKIDLFEVALIDDGNAVNVTAVLVNTDTFDAEFIFRIEDCGNEPVITPSAEIRKSISPAKDVIQYFAVTARVKDET